MESSAEKIIVKYDDLVAGNDISDLIKKAYGPHGAFFLIQDMEFSSFREFPAILKSEQPLFFSFSSWPICHKKF